MTARRRLVKREQALDAMRRVGLEEYVEEAAGKLPDPIDLDRDQELLASYGLTRTQVLDRLGSSP